MSPRGRLLSIVAIPILLSGIATSAVIYGQARAELVARAEHFGNAIAAQLALSVTDPLIQQDLLSLNVVVNELNAHEDFQLVSVYGPDNRLLAQAGKSRGDMMIFTSDIVFQNATTGYVQLGMEDVTLASPLNAVIATAVFIHLLVLAVVSSVTWLYGDLIFAWISSREVAAKTSSTQQEIQPTAKELVHSTHALLVVKVRPVRQLEAHRSQIVGAMGLYRGEVDITDGDDIVVTYKSADQLLQAMLSAALVQSMMESLRGTVRCGIHLIASDSEGAQVASAKKHATHLASISDDKILMSRQVYEEAKALSQVTIDEYHSALTPDGEVYFLASLSDTNRDLIQRQARQFI